MVPFLSQERIKCIKDEMIRFLWLDGSSKIALNTLERPIAEGGMNLTNLEEFFSGLKISWIKRLETTDSFWKKLLLAELEDTGLNTDRLYLAGDGFSAKISKKLSNPFWKEAFQAFSRWQLKLQRINSDSLRTPIWLNTDITRGRSCLIPEDFHKWFEKGITEIGDLRDDSGNLLGFYDFCSRKGITNSPLNKLLFTGLIQAVKSRKTFNTYVLKEDDINRPRHSLTSELIFSRGKGCRKFREIDIK